MIPENEVKQISQTLEVPLPNVEKDYVMGWLLKGIYEHGFLSQNLILKGGNCLRKVYFTDTRFSDDLDFTISRYVEADYFKTHIQQICKELTDKVGIKFCLDATRVDEKSTPDEECKAIDGRVYFQGFAGDSSLTFRIKFDLSDYEQIALPPQKHPLIHNFSDKEACTASIYSYSIEEVLAEKLRSWIQRTRPQDMYDIVKIIQSQLVPISYKNILSAFLKKTIYKNVVNAGKEDMLYDGKFKTIEVSWKDVLVCPVNAVISVTNAIELFKQFIENLFSGERINEAIGSGYSRTILNTYYNRAMLAMRETIIQAARQRKLISMSYHNKVRIIEPYSFKYQKGHENFFGWDCTRGNHIKCFTIQKIQGVSIQPKTYSPRYPVEI